MFISAVQYVTSVITPQNDKDAKVLNRVKEIIEKHLPRMKKFLDTPSLFPDGMASERDPIHTHMLRGDIMENSDMMPDFKIFFSKLTTDQKQLVFAFLVYIDTGRDKVSSQFLPRVENHATDFLNRSNPHAKEVTQLNRLRPQVRDAIPINTRLALHGIAALFIRECRLVFQPKIAASMDHHFDSMRQSIRDQAFAQKRPIGTALLNGIAATQFGYEKNETILPNMPISVRVTDPKTKAPRQIDTDDSKIFWLEYPRNLYFIEFRDFTRSNATRYIVGPDFPLGNQPVEQFLFFESQPEALSALVLYQQSHQTLADLKPIKPQSQFHTPKKTGLSAFVYTWCTIV